MDFQFTNSQTNFGLVKTIFSPRFFRCPNFAQFVSEFDDHPFSSFLSDSGNRGQISDAGAATGAAAYAIRFDAAAITEPDDPMAALPVDEILGIIEG